MEEAWGRFGDSQEAEEKQRKYCFKPDKADYMDSDTFHVYTDPNTDVEYFTSVGQGGLIHAMCVRVNRHGKPIINSDFKSDKSSDDDDPNLKADWQVYKMTKYKDILAPEILNLFSESERKIIGEMDLTDNGSEYFNWNGLLMHGSAIDIRKVTNLVGLSITYTLADFSTSENDFDEKNILINQSGNEARQRTQIAYNLGMYLMKNQNSAYEWKKLKEDSADPTVRASNQFAKEILMPKKLVYNQVKRYKSLIELINNQKIDWGKIDTENMIKFLCKDFKVNELVMKYRLINLGVVEYQENSVV